MSEINQEELTRERNNVVARLKPLQAKIQQRNNSQRKKPKRIDPNGAIPTMECRMAYLRAVQLYFPKDNWDHVHAYTMSNKRSREKGFWTLARLCDLAQVDVNLYLAYMMSIAERRPSVDTLCRPELVQKYKVYEKY